MELFVNEEFLAELYVFLIKDVWEEGIYCMLSNRELLSEENG